MSSRAFRAGEGGGWAPAKGTKGRKAQAARRAGTQAGRQASAKQPSRVQQGVVDGGQRAAEERGRLVQRNNYKRRMWCFLVISRRCGWSTGRGAEVGRGRFKHKHMQVTGVWRHCRAR
ncbi:hypothetical protein J1614_002894 [Plenodomus biglobosus]|nr:hypothetical protein J1614_002894 [Plenodomus biglobosus]